MLTAKPNVEIIFYDGIAPTGKLVIKGALMSEVRQVLTNAGYNGDDFSLGLIKDIQFEQPITLNALAIAMAFSSKGTVNNE